MKYVTDLQSNQNRMELYLFILKTPNVLVPDIVEGRKNVSRKSEKVL
jgi:hypothetical protein